ncbi:MAG: hypothetical protein BGN98_01110 [Microbacterium sp. 69-7]|uniref:hypothetical protein n=1 Tax=Microbacterium sp. 69-7 TaxID=1895784 RepID=UPI00096802FB|nr:hypothetical protein [Microbacterium sp. 69-7]OJU45634.1 MAG: hypothetical protein BGN98_01110 [Microbacterium sp. 69-7]
MGTRTFARVAAGVCLTAATALGPVGVAGAASATAPDDGSSAGPQATSQMVIQVVFPPHERGPASPRPHPSAVPGLSNARPVDGSALDGRLAPTGDQLTGALVFTAAAAALLGAGALLRRRAARH